MRILPVGLVLLAGQMITMQSRPVVRLEPHKNTIEAKVGGALVELINAPEIVYLPPSPPTLDAQGAPWSVEVKNFGPASVTVMGAKTHFQVQIGPGRTVRINSNGAAYQLRQ